MTQPVSQPTTTQERRYAKEFIPASISQDGRGHWRIADGEDNRVATCWDSYNADRIVEALNEHWNRRVSSSPTATEDNGQWLNTAKSLIASYGEACTVDEDLRVGAWNALVHHLKRRPERSAPVEEPPTNEVLCEAIELTAKAIDAQHGIPRHAQVIDYAGIIAAAQKKVRSSSSVPDSPTPDRKAEHALICNGCEWCLSSGGNA